MVARMTRPTPNFVILDRSLLTVERLVAAMLQARDNCGRELSALDMHRKANVLISVALEFAGSSSNLTWHRK